MKRVHIHIGVKNLEDAIRFYTALFGAAPMKIKPDYAKWLLDDPHVNVAVSTRASKLGVDHLGIQVDDAHEWADMRGRLKQADMTVFDEGETVCCYARSEKTWVQDPVGLPWETYRTMEEAEVFSGQAHHAGQARCSPDTRGNPDCCESSPLTRDCCLS